MLKNVMLIVFGFCSLIYSEVSHTGLTGTNIHTVYRWQFADSAARVNQSVAAADTMKLAYQRSDSTSWILLSTTGTKWKKISFASNQNTLTTSNVQFNNVQSVRDSTSDVIVRDSLISVTGTFSGALTGTTLNTGNGANELYAMDQNIRTTDDVAFDSISQRVITVNNGDSAGIIVGPNSSFGATLRIGGWNNNDTRARITSSDGNIHIDNDTSQRGVFINNYFPEDVYIGGGGGEVDINKALADSIKIGTGSYLKTYVEGSFPCTLKTSDVTVQQIGTAYYTKIGNVLTMSLPFLAGTSNSSTLGIYCVIPYFPKQQVSGYGYWTEIKRAQDNGSTILATYSISENPTASNRIILNGYPTTTFTSSGVKGITAVTISYITQ